MKFKEIINRLTGITTPVFGVNWNPPELESRVAQNVITELEDRRVLFNPSELEVPSYCVDSVIQIRRSLTEEIKKLDQSSSLAGNLQAMRAACRKFLDIVGSDNRITRYGSHHGHYASWHFNSAIGELRGVFGVHIAQIAVQHGIDVIEPLSSILPAEGDTL